MAGRRDDHAGHAGAAPGLSGWTRRGALGAGLALPLLPGWAQGAPGLADVPIRLTGNTPWTGVWLDKQGPFRFRIVSGTNVFLIYEALARRIGLELATAEDTIASNRYKRQVVTPYRVKEMVVGGALPLANIRLLPLPGAREPLYPGSVPIPSDRITSFDWAGQMMRYSADLPAEAATAYGKVPLRHSDIGIGWIPKVDCRLGGKPLRLRLSTGSAYGLTLYPDAVKRLGLWNGPEPHYDRKIEGNGRDLEIRIVRRGDLELGGLRFERPVLGLYDPAHVLMDLNENDDGEIGMEVLRRVDLIFDPRRDMSWMRPNAAMADGWTYDRAGFQVITADSGTRVERVDPGSPAEKAGLKAGDMIGTNEENVRRLVAAQMMPAGTKIDIPIVRDGAKMRIPVITEERL
ncbi:MAG: aspartyl protease family protein [Phenylobacterium sp.]